MDHSDPPTQAELTREEMEQIHKFLRHAGSHATYQWFTPRNIAIMWNKMKALIGYILITHSKFIA